MEIIKVSRVKLLDTLKKNREVHAAEYELAEKGYWIKVEEALKANLKEIRKTGKTDLAGYWNLRGPENHTKDYDLVITMMEYSVEDVIELDQQRFQQYVMDNWSWSTSTKYVNNLYASAALGAK
jgi:NOL1/NOP2/fmu family ribosome biogenesis protein